MTTQKEKPDEKLIHISNTVNNIYQSAGYGDRETIHQQMTRGINMIATGQSVPQNRINNGIVFFTRPRLNLTYVNLSRERTLLQYRDADPYSYMAMARAYLDPNTHGLPAFPYKDITGIYRDPTENIIDCPLVDPKNPFISVMTNDCISLNGWPDARIETYLSDKGIANEQWMMADGLIDIHDSFDLDANFRGSMGDPIFAVLDLWTKYMSYVRVNRVWPHPQMLALRMIDYMTRIYSFTLDANRTHITHWAACGVGIPTNNPQGKVHDYNSEELIKTGLDQISIRFQCLGATYNDIIVLYEFNKLMALFNPDLELRSHEFKTISNDFLDNIPLANKGNNQDPRAPYIKLLPGEKAKANYCAYPLVNLFTRELEWWVRRDDFIRYVLGREIEQNSDEETRAKDLGFFSRQHQE